MPEACFLRHPTDGADAVCAILEPPKSPREVSALATVGTVQGEIVEICL